MVPNISSPNDDAFLLNHFAMWLREKKKNIYPKTSIHASSPPFWFLLGFFHPGTSVHISFFHFFHPGRSKENENDKKDFLLFFFLLFLKKPLGSIRLFHKRRMWRGERKGEERRKKKKKKKRKKEGDSIRIREHDGRRDGVFVFWNHLIFSTSFLSSEFNIKKQTRTMLVCS